jgi:AraC-like DNA-binding protein
MNPTLVRPDMRYWRIVPDPRLRPGIACYVVALPAVEARNPLWQEELLLPDGYSELVFSLTAQFERWPVGESQRRSTMYSSYIVGGRSHSVLTRNLGDLTIIGVKLEPGVLRRLIATPLSELKDTTLSLAELNQQALLDLEDALANARAIERIAALLDNFFLARLSILEPGDQLVVELVRHIRVRQGALSIMQWIRERDVDVRHFERRFCAWTGMTPKRFARIVRFRHGYYRLVCGEAHRGAIGRHLEDYYDQSHFCRDFKYFMGVPPKARLARAMTQGMDISDHLLQAEFHAP